MSISESDISRVMDEMFDQAKLGREPEVIERKSDSELRGRDIYEDHKQKDRKVLDRVYTNGSSPIARHAVISVIETPKADGFTLADEWNKTRLAIQKALKHSRVDTAEAIRRQYMENHFLPAVVVVVNSSSPDEVVGSEYITKKLDAYAIPNISQSHGPGYTEQWVKTRYAEHLGGGRQAVSDPTVREYMRKINYNFDEGNPRTALSYAVKCKKMVDDGDALAGEADYELLERIVSYYGWRPIR